MNSCDKFADVYAIGLAATSRRPRRIMTRSKLTLSLVCALTLGFSSAMAQTGTIQGNVTDAAGATVPNAKITAFDQDKSVVVRETTTNREGAFALTPLLPGQYTVKVEAQGFKSYESSDLKLDQNQIMN